MQSGAPARAAKVKVPISATLEFFRRKFAAVANLPQCCDRKFGAGLKLTRRNLFILHHQKSNAKSYKIVSFLYRYFSGGVLTRLNVLYSLICDSGTSLFAGTKSTIEACDFVISSMGASLSKSKETIILFDIS